MNPAPSLMQLGLFAAVNALAFVTATLLIYQRHLQYIHHPEDVAALSGMYAGGDLLLAAFIEFMLLFAFINSLSCMGIVGQAVTVL